MHIIIYYVVKHLFRGLTLLIQHVAHHAPAAHSAVRQAAAAHMVAAHTVLAQGGAIPGGNTAAALHGFNQQSTIMASVGQQQAAAIPDVGDFSY